MPRAIDFHQHALSSLRLALSLWLLATAFASNSAIQDQTPVAGGLNHQALTDFALHQTGDGNRGKVLFTDETRLGCTKCHSTDGTAGKAGPDLGSIGDKFGRSELILSILEPSATIAVGYGTTIVETSDGETVQGIIKQATESWIELVGADGKPTRISISNIRDQRTSDVSLMPEGLERGLAPGEFVDLLAYLESLHPSVTNIAVQGMPESIPQATRSVDLVPFFGAGVRLNRPLWFGEIPGFTNRFVVLEHGGKSWIVERSAAGDQQTTLIDLSSEVRVGGATGLLGMAFHPRFLEHRKYYLKYQLLKNGRIVTRLVQRTFSKDFKADSGQPSNILLEIGAVTQDHNGGALAFGPDGFLYFGMGDSGPQRDPQGHGQSLNTFLGKILRLDVDHPEGDRAYGIPKDNPLIKRSEAKPEIWAYGFREPWRISFDRLTGDLWVGDVGQDRVEEVGIIRRGENHGWNVYEGHTRFSDQYRRADETYVPPVFSYSHRIGVSVTGGYVYRGQHAPHMQGRYICGDFESRRLWALTQTNRLLANIIEIGRAPTRVVSFSEDHAGEPYLVGYDSGIIYRMDLASIDPAPRLTRIIAATSEESPVLWRYTIQAPTNDWFRSDFNDSAWQLAPAGFGTQGTPGAVVRTEWRASDIWLRRSFNVGVLPARTSGESLALRVHHDEDSEIYLNGVQIAALPRWTTGYIEEPLDPATSIALSAGRNTIAIHCHQITGGQYIDAGLVEYTAPQPRLGSRTVNGKTYDN